MSALLLRVAPLAAVLYFPSLCQARDANNKSALIEEGGAHLERSYQLLSDYQSAKKKADDLKEAACATRYGTGLSPAVEADGKGSVKSAGPGWSGERAEAIAADTALQSQQAAYRAEARKAYDLFAQAARLDAKDPQALCWEAAALLQMENYCAAAAKASEAKKLGYRDPNKSLFFIQARALTKNPNSSADELQEGIEELQEYQRFVTQRPDLADQRPTANAELKAATGALTARNAKKCLTTWLQSYPYLKPFACDAVPAHTELPFNVGLQSGIGYNDNAISLGYHQPLPATSPSKSDVFNESVLSLTRDISFLHLYQPSDQPPDCGFLSKTPQRFSLSDTMSLSYILTADTFDKISSKNSLVNTASWSYKHVSAPHWFELIKLTDQFSYLDGIFASNKFVAQAAVNFAETNRLNTQLSYFLTRNDGYLTTTPLADPDGFTHRLELLQSAVILQDAENFTPALSATLLYAREWAVTRGIEGHVINDDLLGRLQWDHHVHAACSFIRGYSVVVSDEWKPDRYNHAFIPSETDPDRYNREDWTNAISVSLSVRMWYDELMKNAGVIDASRMEASVIFRHTNQNSNVDGKDFDQNYFLASLKFNF